MSNSSNGKAGNVDLHKVSYNFGVQGWKMIIFQVIWLFFMTGMTVDGLNIIVPNMAAFHGWDENLVLSISTPASLIALILTMFWGKLSMTFGLKKVHVVTMFLGGISLIAYGFSSSIGMYAVTLVCAVTFINAFAINCGFSIIANWFPTQKGVIMGLTTIGMNLASATISIILNALTTRYNIQIAIAVMGVVVIIVGLLTLFFTTATPEESGCLPDNDPEVAKLIHSEEAKLEEDGVKGITYKDALSNPKVWILGIAYGCFGLATVGIMSQLVGFFTTAKGFVVPQALMVITIAAIIGMVGSWAWGVVDQKIGTKKASILFGIWYFVGILFLLPGSTITMYIGIFMLGAAIGGNGNFAPSMASFIFGRRDFAISYAVLNTLVGVVRSCSFFVLAFTRAAFQGYTVPYIIMACIALLGSVLIALTKVTGAVGASVGINETE